MALMIPQLLDCLPSDSRALGLLVLSPEHLQTSTGGEWDVYLTVLSTQSHALP